MIPRLGLASRARLWLASRPFIAQREVATICRAFIALSGALFTLVTIAFARQDLPRFTSQTQSVELTAVVTDRQGRPVADLAIDDFEVREDGRLEKIEAFDFVDLREQSRSPRAEVLPSDVESNAGNGRIFVIMFDPPARDFGMVTHTAYPKLAQRVARQFVNEVLRPGDLVAVVHVRGSVKDGQGFTRQRDLILASIGRLKSWETGQSAAEEVRRIVDSYDAIEQVCQRLGGVSGRQKAILWFGSDLPFEPADTFDNGAQQSTVSFAQRDALQAATRNNVTIHTIDAVGLSTESSRRVTTSLNPLAANEGPAPPAPGALPPSELGRVAALRLIAAETGGRAVVGTNNFGDEFEKIGQQDDAYYVLGYSPEIEHRDGRFHPISVAVRRSGLTVRSRHGYYAPRPESKELESTAVPEGVSLEASRALRSPVPVAGLGMQAFAAPFRGVDADTASVLVGVRLSAESLKLDTGAELETSYLTIDTGGKVTPGVRGIFTLTLKEADRTASKPGGVQYHERLDLAPGRHELRLVAHQTGVATGSVVTHVDVPNFGHEPIALSGILLAASGGTDRTLRSDARARSLLRQDPTTTRAFRSSQTLTAFVEMYREPPSTDGDARLTATVSRRGKVVRTVPGMRIPGEPGRSGYTVTVPLDGLAAGTYILKIEARAGRRSTAREVALSVTE